MGTEPEQTAQLTLAKVDGPTSMDLKAKVQALHVAIPTVSLDDLRAFLKEGVPVNERLEPYKSTYLIQAAFCDRADLVACLLKEGANVNLITKGGLNALGAACRSNSLRCARLLIEAGVRINTWRSRSPLFYAVSNGNLQLVQLLVQKGAHYVFRRSEYPTALSLAMDKKHIDVALWLSENCGKSVNSVTGSKEEPLLFIAARTGNAVLVSELLVNRGVDVNTQCSSGRTALMAAAESGETHMSRQLLDHGADVNIQDKKGNTAIILASHQGKDQILQILLTTGADLDLTNEDGIAAPFASVESGCVETVRLLLEKGCRLDVKDRKYGQTLLHWACKQSSLEMLKLFVERMDLEAEDNNQSKPIHVAAQHNKDQLLNYLIDSGCDVDTIQSSTGFTPLSVAVLHDAVSAVNALIAKGANLDHRDANQETPLILACTKENKQIMNILIDAGADPHLPVEIIIEHCNPELPPNGIAMALEIL